MKKIICTVCFSLAVLFNGNANAAYSILIDNSDQDNVFSLYFVTDEYAVVAGYQLDFAYDDTEMSYVGYTNDVPSVGIIPDMFGAPNGTTPGIINNFNAFTFFGSPYYAEAGSTTLIGTLTFSINDGAIADGERDLWMNLNP
ncbi:MAG: hypothetical protein ACOX5Z_02635 [Desulfobulbus sp.]|jgi:hypothetical protein